MTESNRDDFPLSVKKALAARAGNVCSYPDCDAPTSGPSDEGTMAYASTGEAAHIAAASGGPGARRVVPTMTPEQRSSFENGIWMCRLHGKIVDTDEERFTVPLLQNMKHLAENRARLRQALQPFCAEQFDLLTYDIEITSTNLSELTIANAFSDAAIPLLWGKANSAAVRDFTFEMVQNALTHGGATRVLLTITSKLLTLEDDGSEFGPDNLKSSSKPRGGASAFRALDKIGERLIIAHRFGCGNRYTIQYLRSHADVAAETPCHALVNMWNRETPFDTADLERVSQCQTVHIILPEYMAFSRAFDFREIVPRYFAGKKIVFVGYELSEQVQNFLEQIPGSTYVELPER